MDWKGFQEFITQVGFPVAFCFILFWKDYQFTSGIIANTARSLEILERIARLLEQRERP